MPLTFDLSFDELVKYQGINPRPADFDAFWDSSLKEMRSIDHCLVESCWFQRRISAVPQDRHQRLGFRATRSYIQHLPQN